MTEQEKDKKRLDAAHLVAVVSSAMRKAGIEALDKIEDRTEAWILYSRALNGIFNEHYNLSLKFTSEIVWDAQQQAPTPEGEKEGA